jgi:hypothetical protein
MYDLLTTTELTVLQSMLFEGTENAYRVASVREANPRWTANYRPVHVELGNLFIEAGTELLLRLDQQVRAA